MNLKFKGFALVPLLGVMFLLVISGVTSYVVINQGTGGYKARATFTTSCVAKPGEKCGMGLKLSCPDGGTVFCEGSSQCKKGRCPYPPSSATPTPTNTPVSDNPPTDETPTDETPTADTPADEGTPDETPTDETPAADTPTAEAPTTTGNATVALTMKLQGVTGLPAGSKTVPFKAKLKNATTTTDYVTGTLTANSSGKWTGTADFTSIPLGTNNGYSIFVKVGKHFQKKVCVDSPTETLGGTYSCSENGITLAAGENSLDFSNILQLVGDLPTASGEQNGVVDSYDKGFILNNQRSTSASVLETGDLNFDGTIDTNDWSLILQSLNVKVDDSDK